MRSERRGFTLIELMVVIFIIGVLAALILTAVDRARAGAVKAKAVKAVGEIAGALDTWRTQRGSLPPLQNDVIWTHLTGEGDGKYYDSARKETFRTPLNYPQDQFDSNDRLKDPWYDRSSDQYYRVSASGPSLGEPSGKDYYVWSIGDPDERESTDAATAVIGNWRK